MKMFFYTPYMHSFFSTMFLEPRRSFKAKYQAFIAAAMREKQEFCATVNTVMSRFFQLATLMGLHERVI
jgi:hypothetical protein